MVDEVNATTLSGVRNHHGLRVKDGDRKPEVAISLVLSYRDEIPTPTTVYAWTTRPIN